MRTLAITQNMSADGSIEFLGDWFDPTDQRRDLNAEVRCGRARQEDVLLLGRQTFTDFRGFWPRQTDDTTGITGTSTGCTRSWCPSTLGDPEWENSTVARRGLARPGARAQGGGRRRHRRDRQPHPVPGAHRGRAGRRVPAVRLPAVQGRGRRLFPDGREAKLELRDSRAFENGVVLLVYAPA